MTPLISVGKSAPLFTLENGDGQIISLKNITSAYTVVFFYPKDNTPGCTIEAKAFSKYLKAFEKLNVTVVGISGGDRKSKTAFCEKHKLTVTLLSDTDFALAKKYGVFGEKYFMGRKFMGIFRTTFLLNSKHKILKVYEKVSPETHSAEILSDITALNQEEGTVPAGKTSNKQKISKKRRPVIPSTRAGKSSKLRVKSF